MAADGPELPSGWTRVEVPARAADLELRLVLPPGWQVCELPDAEVDFSAPAAFLPLVVAMPSYATIAFSVAARPAYDDGTPAQWLAWLAREQGLDPGPVEADAIGSGAAAACWCGADSDGTPIRQRLMLWADADRLLVVVAMAPMPLWAAVGDSLRAMADALRVVRPHGAARALSPEGSELPASTWTGGTAPAAAPAPAAKAPVRKTPVGVRNEPPAPAEGAFDALPSATMPPEAPTQAAALAIAEDASSLDPEHPHNAAQRERGIGFSPRVHAVCPRGRWATVATGALQATLRVPFGWFASDDGRRLLVYDEGTHSMVRLHRQRRTADAEAFLREVHTELARSVPTASFLRLQLGRYAALGVRGLPASSGHGEQLWLLREAPGDHWLVARASGDSEAMRKAGDLLEVLLDGMHFLDAPGVEPVWWTEAQAMEAVGDIAAAEQLIVAAIDHQGAYEQVALLHERAASRRAAAGDAAGAAAAETARRQWLHRLAASATSGGEGAALQRRVQELLGDDPPAPPA